MFVGTTEAACLLGISPQRVRQLLKEGRIVSAVKEGRFWRIRLFHGMPVVIEKERGIEGTWRKTERRAPTNIYIFGQVLKENSKNNTNYPVISVKQGTRITHCHEADINGPSKLIYRPFNPLPDSKAKLWIEVDPSIEVITKLYA
jgi:hypothetical protein